MTIDGTNMPSTTLTLSSTDGVATLTVKTPASGLGTLKLCIGRADDDLLPANGAGSLNYEVLAEGAFARLTEHTVTFVYETSGTVTMRYVPLPLTSDGRYSDTVTRTATQDNVLSDGSGYAMTLGDAQPGLYMSGNP
jgi:hypothetical protein